MKHYMFYFIFFCLNITQVIYPAFTSREEKHEALKDSISRARDALTPTKATPLSAPASRRPSIDGPDMFTFVSPFQDDEDGRVAAGSSDDDPGRSAAFHPSRAQRRTSESMSVHGLNASTSSIGSLQTPELTTGEEPPTPQQKMRSAITLAKRRRSVTIATPPPSADRGTDDIQMAPPSSRQLNRKQTLVPSHATEGSAGINDDDDVIELHRTSDASVETDPINNRWGYIVAGSTSALTASTATWGIMSWMRPQRRMFTGFEVPAAMFAGQTTAKLFGGAALIVTGTYAATKFNGWLHAGCHSKQKLLEMKFEAALRDRMMEHRQETVKQITDVTTQIKREIDDHRKETADVVGHLVDAVDHAADLLAPQPTAPGKATAQANPEAAARILHAAADKATEEVAAQAARATTILPPPPPQEKTKCGCCCVQ